MSRLTREAIIQSVEGDLASARAAAKQAQEFAVECARNNSISGSGERSVAEGQSAAWQETVAKFEKLRQSLGGGATNRVSLGALAEIEMDGDRFIAVISDVSCQLSNSEVTVVTPQSPLGKVLMGHGQGEAVEYQMGNERVRARVQKVF